MKHSVIAFTLIIFSTQHTLFPMDPTPAYKTVQAINTGLSEDQIVTRISEAINEKYSYNFFVDSFVILSSEKMLEIIQITQAHYPHITESAIKKLKDNNTLFRQSIAYFIHKASENLEKITANNIKTIENPNNHQPTDELNKLPLPIRLYVMNEALVERLFNYDIVLKGQHQNNITAFDICEFTDQAITSSFNKNGLRVGKWDSQIILWNLKTGNPIETLGETDPVCIVAFSPNGSQIAGSLYTENAIKVWCTQTKQLLRKLSSSHAINSLAFSYPTSSMLTAVYYNINRPLETHITQWLLTSENEAGELINNCKVYGGCGQNSSFNGNKYCASHPCVYLATPKTELHITKKSCAPLYLCMQAIQKSGDRSHISKLIESSASFHSLTDLEIQKVRFEINRK